MRRTAIGLALSSMLCACASDPLSEIGGLSSLFDRERGLLYVVATDSSTPPGAVVAIDVALEAVSWSVSLGGPPAQVVLSDDGSTLFAAMLDEPTVAQIDVASRTLTTKFGLGTYERGSGEAPLFAGDLAAVPGGAPSAVAVSLRRPMVTPDFDGVAVFVDGERLPEIAHTLTPARLIEAGESAGTLWGYGDASPSFPFSELRVTADGANEVWAKQSIGAGGNHVMVAAGSRVYFEDGTVVDPTVAEVVRRLPGSGLLEVDLHTNTAWFARLDDGETVIRAVDIETAQVIAEETPPVSGEARGVADFLDRLFIVGTEGTIVVPRP